MLRVEPSQVTPQLKSLFAADDPAWLRGRAVLEGDLAGEVLADDRTHPTWSAVREASGGTTFLSRVIDEVALHQVIATFRQAGSVVIGLRPQDPRWAHLPANADRAGGNIEFFDRAVEQKLEVYSQARPPDCQIRPIDAALFPRCAWYPAICRQFGTADQFFQKGLGFCLVQADDILAEAYLAPAVHGVREIGVRTREAYRRRGFGAILSAYTVQVCEQREDRIYWNTARQNLASLAIARKLGFRTERDYPVKIWLKSS
jgi:GNAT superfamily N-acetyltransferase